MNHPIHPESVRWHGVLPGSHTNSTLETFNSSASPGHQMFLRAANYILDTWRGDKFAGLLLHGSPGSGKSHAAIALARELHQDGAEVHYVSVPELNVHSPSTAMWTEPRMADPYRNRQMSRVTTTESATRADDGSPKVETVTVKEMDEAGVELLVEHNPNSVFASRFDKGLTRNPKTVLVLDDVKPRWHAHAHHAVEAASNAGGLIIMTSNFPILEGLSSPPDSELTDISRMSYNTPPDVQERVAQLRNSEASTINSAYKSRIVPAILPIHFEGIDLRAQNSFWTDFISPEDFQR